MKIVCLDGHTLNPGDLSWDAVRALGEFELYDYTEPDQTVERAKDADIILTNKVIISRAIMDQLPKLKMISVLATGYDIIDIRAASDRNIPVCNVPSYGSYSVAQMVFAHILNFTQRVAYHAETVKQGRWLQSKDFCYWDYPLIELHGKTMGIVGFGRIGRSTAAIAKGFGMKVLAHDIYVTKTDDENVTLVDLETLFRESDFISLHTLLTDQTRHGQRRVVGQDEGDGLPDQHQPRPGDQRGGPLRSVEERPTSRRRPRRQRRGADRPRHPAARTGQLRDHAAHLLGDGRGARPPDADYCRQHRSLPSRQADQRRQLDRQSSSQPDDSPARRIFPEAVDSRKMSLSQETEPPT